MFIFSVPMPFDFNQIDRLVDINNQVEKSKIIYVYNCLPENSCEKSGYEQTRVIHNDIQILDDLLRYSEYAVKSGFKFIYLMNSLNTYDGEEFEKNRPRLDRLCQRLLENGIDEVRVASPFLVEYLNEFFPKIKVRCSTSMEYESIKQYNHLLSLYENIIEIVPSWDLNRNFNFLRNFLSLHSSLSVELMVNEGCMSGCPFRIYHSMISPQKGKYQYNEIFYRRRCDEQIYKNLAETICLSNIIYPWQLDEYEKIGINNFKLIGRNSLEFAKGNYGAVYLDYLKGVDSIDNILELPFFEFNHYIFSNPEYRDIKVRDVIDYLPEIAFFVNKKEACNDVCGASCRYCYEKAARFKESDELLKLTPK